MKVTQKDLWETAGAVAQLAAVEFDDETISFRIGRIHDAVLSHTKRLQQSHSRLLRKYGKEQVTEDGKPAGTYYIPSGTDEEDRFNAEWDKLTSEEVQILAEVDYDPLTLKALREAMGPVDPDDESKGFKRLPLRPVFLGALARWLIVNDTEAAAKPKKLKAATGD